ncbi:glycosyltransferase family 4 protein [Desulforhopalus sp. IMCC35007]|uniref:glycosyltransferase family 4 protein n=1 Tax=Desulforhopalus sp. IMCC35007 TaxID=2569543 RepID=UPI0010AE8249|nr:glycosyltransferase family 4 protein [Desulforhopalus sp. IMCC35007]TKB07659.1 glycosyltransferase family 4 protein [Desulforhopalus sp. IMCC35007]
MKILHLISQHPQQTGSGFYVQNLIRNCSRKGYQNHLIAGISGNVHPELPGIPPDNCTYIPFSCPPLDFTIPGMSDVMPYPSSRFSDLSEQQLLCYTSVFADTIRKTVQVFCPDVIHSHHLWLATVIARSVCPHIPMVTSCHSTDLRQYLQNPHLQQKIYSLEQIQTILALSQTQAEQIVEIHGLQREKIDIVGGGYDTSRFSIGKKAETPPVQLLYAGKLSASKGVPLLLEAYAQLDDPRTHLHLVGSGSGAEKDRCIQLANNLGNRISVHGALPQEKLAQLMAECHVFILPSFFEGLPLVLLEALSSGCRIICSDLPGCKELLGSAPQDLVEFIELPNMVKVDQPDPSQMDLLTQRVIRSLKKITETVLTSPPPSPGSIASITHTYSWESVFSRIEQAYKKAISR